MRNFYRKWNIDLMKGHWLRRPDLKYLTKNLRNEVIREDYAFRSTEDF